MFLKLRIILTILSAICAALVLPLGTWFGLLWAIIAAVSAGIFFLIMLICKQEQEKREPPENQELNTSEINYKDDEETN